MLDTKLIALELRPYLDIQTSLLLNIKSNLTKLLAEPMSEADPMLLEIMRNAWKAETNALDQELIKRN